MISRFFTTNWGAARAKAQQTRSVLAWDGLYHTNGVKNFEYNEPAKRLTVNGTATEIVEQVLQPIPSQTHTPAPITQKSKLSNFSTWGCLNAIAIRPYEHRAKWLGGGLYFIPNRLTSAKWAALLAGTNKAFFEFSNSWILKDRWAAARYSTTVVAAPIAAVTSATNYGAKSPLGKLAESLSEKGTKKRKGSAEGRGQATDSDITLRAENNILSYNVNTASEAISHGTSNPSLPSRNKSFEEFSHRSVGIWLLGSSALVFGIVVLGGLTRLTESGLSITEWKPVTGAIPPLNQIDWEENFAKYQDSPEYKILNQNMTLEEYKFIYHMEWAHRLWGRIIGLTFILPAAYFIARRKVSTKMARRLVGISCLIAFQGFIGWWMVKSGLQDDLFQESNSHPRVSQYRLAAHLTVAITVYLSMLYNGLQILQTHRYLRNPSLLSLEAGHLSSPSLKVLKRSIVALAILTFTTALSGALVAGLDAGLIYNEFPKMGTGYRPSNEELFSPFYARDKENLSDLVWRNMFENPTMVQFQHRYLALVTFFSTLAFGAYSKLSSDVKIHITKGLRRGIHGLVMFAIVQVTLGISTLIYMVPTPLAVAHQAGALAILSQIVALSARVRTPLAIARMGNGNAVIQTMRKVQLPLKSSPILPGSRFLVNKNSK